MFADAAPAVVRECGEVGEEAPSFGIIGLEYLGGPREGGERGEIAVAAADAGVYHGGDVAGACEVPLSYCLGEDLGWVEAGEFGGVQGAVEPLFGLAV